MLTCPNCGRENPEDFKFCAECGTALGAEAVQARELRKLVTVVFADITGSTALGEQVDPELLRRVLERYFEEMQRILEHHGGTVEKFIGDAIMAVFGIPHLHEDDALRAVRATAEMRERLAELNEQLAIDYGMRLQARMGVASGEVVAGDPGRGDWFVTGDAVNVAERLERSAAPDEIVVAQETCRLVRDAVEVEPLEPLTVKGKAEPLSACRLLKVTPGAPAHERRSDSPMVGRMGEFELLRQAFGRAVSERACHFFTVLGAAGVGKSRLLSEFLDEVEPKATILTGRCLPYGEGITFWPLLEAVGTAAGLAEGEPPEVARTKIASLLSGEEAADLAAERVAGLLGLAETGASAEEGFWGVRKLLEALARRTPLVLVFDDLNWGEPTFLDLLEHIADWSRDAPILLVGMARPELTEMRPGWAGGKRNATTIFLEALSAQDCATLIHNLLGQAALAAEVQNRVQAAAEGNPLFVEETLAMLIEEGLIVRRNGRWVVARNLSQVRVPPTIQLLLASRLDQLGHEERQAIERAAVEGDIFHLGSVEALTPAESRAGVGDCLLGLVRKELIRPHRATFAGEDAFRFRHLLIHEAAYHAVPKEMRAELHEGCSRWLAEKGGEFDELVAYHLEQAVRFRSELGPLDAHGQDLAARGGNLLATAARRASARGDMPAAVGLFERSVALLRDEPERAEALLDLAAALLETGDFTRTEQVITEATESAATREDRPLAARAELERSKMQLLVEREMSHADSLRQVEGAIATLEQAGDDAALARAWWVVGEMAWLRCEFTAAEEAMTRSLAHAERAGAPREVLRARTFLALAAVDGPRPVPEALLRCREILDQARGDPVLEANVGYAMASAEAMQGRFDEARELAARSAAIYEEIGMPFSLATWSHWPGTVELLAGDLEAAEQIFRSGYETLVSLGEKLNLSSIAISLAETLYLQGRAEEAEQLTMVSEEASSQEDVWAQVAWRSARAKILAQRGVLADAEMLAREAVELIAEKDVLNMRGHALISLAEVLLAGNRVEEASECAAEGVRLYEAKENVVATEKARAIVAPGRLTTGAA
jgi:class 3 adenylate cyclase/tetratricopeptide (TPR) repeat protein